ncbi:MAG: hypothetical protein AB8B97_11850, partial [Granulosicoccus sp.]
MSEADTERYFSQRSDNELAEFAKAIDPQRNINSGLGPDARADLFKHLAQNLTPGTRNRFNDKLSDSLARELDKSTESFAVPVLSATRPVDDRTASGSGSDFTEHFRNELGTGQQFKQMIRIEVDVFAEYVRTQSTDTPATQNQLRVLYERNLALTDGLPGDLSDFERQLLAAQMTNVNADALRVAEGTLGWNVLAATIQQTSDDFRAAGIEPLLRLNRHGHVGTLVSSLWRGNGDGDDPLVERWHFKRLTEAGRAATLNAASLMFNTFKHASAGYDLDYVNTYENTLIDRSGHFLRRQAYVNATPMDFGTLAPAGSQSNIDFLISRQPELIEQGESAQGDRGRLLSYAARELELAAQILGISINDPSFQMLSTESEKWDSMRATIRGLFRTLHAEDLGDLGYATTRRRYDSQGEWIGQEDLGPYGNFGPDKKALAEAYLNSSIEQRLEYLGVAPETWSMVEQMILRALVAESDAKAIKKAEFGFDDFIKGIIGGTFTAAGFLFPPAAFGSSLFATLAAAGLQSGLTGFGLTFAITGDIRAALRVGGENLITGAFTGLAGQFTGKTRVVAEAFANGVASELQGRDFEDGVLESVLSEFGSQLGDGLQENLRNMAPDFVADLGGKLLEEAIVNGGEIPNIDDLIASYIRSYAEGAVESRLTDVFGPESAAHYAEIFVGAGEAVIDGGSNALSNYLQSDQFMNALGNGISADVVEHFGGPESFRAQILGDVAQIVIQANGDSDKLTQGLMSIGQTMLSRYAGESVRTQLSADPKQPSELVDTLATLLEIGVASGFDHSTMRGYAFGPLLDTLTGSVVEGLFGPTVDADSPSVATFLRDAIPRLAQSYERHDGDMTGIGQDMSLFLSEQLAKGLAANDPLDTADNANDLEGADEGGLGGTNNAVHNEATQALIRSMLEGAPEGWEPESDNLQVASFGSWFFRDQIDKDLAHFSQRLLHPDVNLDRALDPDFAHEYPQTVLQTIQSFELSRIEPLFKDMAKGMDPKHLRMVFEGLPENYQDTLVQAISNYGGEEVKQAFVDQVQRSQIARHASGFSLTPGHKELLLDSGQIALDIVGIFDPTGIADGANAGISLLRGDFFGAFISAVSIIPVIGDLAKLGKLGTMAETVANVAEEFKGLTRSQMESSSLYRAMKPVFETISSAIDQAQTGAGKAIWDRLDPEHRETLLSMKQKVDDVLNFRTGPIVTRP